MGSSSSVASHNLEGSVMYFVFKPESPTWSGRIVENHASISVRVVWCSWVVDSGAHPNDTIGICCGKNTLLDLVHHHHPRLEIVLRLT
jgi:hypothetical protein